MLRRLCRIMLRILGASHNFWDKSCGILGITCCQCPQGTTPKPKNPKPGGIRPQYAKQNPSNLRFMLWVVPEFAPQPQYVLHPFGTTSHAPHDYVVTHYVTTLYRWFCPCLLCSWGHTPPVCSAPTTFVPKVVGAKLNPKS